MEIIDDKSSNTTATKIKKVLKRNGSLQDYDDQQILDQLTILAKGLNKEYVKLDIMLKKIERGLYDGIKTTDIDELAAETAAYMNIVHPEYSLLAARIAVNNLHKETKTSFFETVTDLYRYKDKSGRAANLIADDVYQIIKANAERLDNEIQYTRDYTYDFFGFKTLERSYLLKLYGKVAERPQHMLMRVSIGIHKDDIEAAIQTYHLMSEKWFTHASPTLFNSGTPRPQMSSCFLVAMSEDSIDGIYDTLKQCALISKSAGGIGLSIHNIRARGSYIRGTNGVSNGIVPMLRVYNDTARYVDQGGGKRKGAIAIYIEPWHADVFDFLQLRKNHGKEEQRARDLFYGLWIPDLFMERCENDEDWTLMCPNECPGLHEVYGEQFNALYRKYEKEGRGMETVKARKLWNEIIQSQIETGTPYMLYKDAANRKSNQKNLGTIKSSNLCTEIIQYTSKEEIAVCNLASISLSKFVDKKKKIFDYQKLYEISYIITKNLNKVIDFNYYPTPEAKTSNLKHRPIGIGIQGLADVFIMLKIHYESPEAFQVDEKIFETIYFGALHASKDLAKVHGPYSSFKGSPASEGILQFDMWGKIPSNGYDWNGLKEEIKQYGLRNSLLIAPMPTASTSQILGNNESFEPYTSNLYTRRVLSGEFVCINSHLVEDLIEKELWTPEIKNKLISENGSVQNIPEIPQDIKNIYKTVWEISQKVIIDHSVIRAPFIDQSQSLNIHISDPNLSRLTSMHFYAWKKGLKTGMYYLRSRPAADAIKFTVDVEMLLKDAGKIEISAAHEKKEVEESKSNKDSDSTFEEEEDKNKRSKKVKKTSLPICTDPDNCISCGS